MGLVQICVYGSADIWEYRYVGVLARVCGAGMCIGAGICVCGCKYVGITCMWGMQISVCGADYVWAQV